MHVEGLGSRFSSTTLITSLCSIYNNNNSFPISNWFKVQHGSVMLMSDKKQQQPASGLAQRIDSPKTERLTN